MSILVSNYPTMDTDAIIKYFGLNEHPFISTPDPRFLYFSSQVKEALAKCEFMARDRVGPIYMYGPIGSGKTSPVRRLQEKLRCHRESCVTTSGNKRSW